MARLIHKQVTIMCVRVLFFHCLYQYDISTSMRTAKLWCVVHMYLYCTCDAQLTYINPKFTEHRVLIDKALLPLNEVLNGLFSPPHFNLACLIEQSSCTCRERNHNQHKSAKKVVMRHWDIS